jgi:myo-inositol-1(or 4)-monophosphatase
MVEEAGGRVEMQDASDMIRDGGRVVVGTPEVFNTLADIADRAWNG